MPGGSTEGVEGETGAIEARSCRLQGWCIRVSWSVCVDLNFSCTGVHVMRAGKKPGTTGSMKEKELWKRVELPTLCPSLQNCVRNRNLTPIRQAFSKLFFARNCKIALQVWTKSRYLDKYSTNFRKSKFLKLRSI